MMERITVNRMTDLLLRLSEVEKGHATHARCENFEAIDKPSSALAPRFIAPDRSIRH